MARAQVPVWYRWVYDLRCKRVMLSLHICVLCMRTCSGLTKVDPNFNDKGVSRDILTGEQTLVRLC